MVCVCLWLLRISLCSCCVCVRVCVVCCVCCVLVRGGECLFLFVLRLCVSACASFVFVLCLLRPCLWWCVLLFVCIVNMCLCLCLCVLVFVRGAPVGVCFVFGKCLFPCVFLVAAFGLCVL